VDKREREREREIERGKRGSIIHDPRRVRFILQDCKRASPGWKIQRGGIYRGQIASCGTRSRRIAQDRGRLSSRDDSVYRDRSTIGGNFDLSK